MTGEAPSGVRGSEVTAILTDIEGTTAPISFVADVLFPFAAERLPAFVAARGREPAIAALLDETRALAGEPQADESRAVAILLGWIAEDRKAAPLKSLQGMIWREGYESGAIVSPVYPDAAQRLRAWKDAGFAQAVYSSGSVEAQKLLYAYSDAGDLTPVFDAYFDTRNGGPKTEAGSYVRIASEMGRRPEAIAFLSDNPREVAAAVAAGMRAWRIDRALDAGSGFVDSEGFQVAADFDVVARALAR